MSDSEHDSDEYASAEEVELDPEDPTATEVASNVESASAKLEKCEVADEGGEKSTPGDESGGGEPVADASDQPPPVDASATEPENADQGEVETANEDDSAAKDDDDSPAGEDLKSEVDPPAVENSETSQSVVEEAIGSAQEASTPEVSSPSPSPEPPVPKPAASQPAPAPAAAAAAGSGASWSSWSSWGMSLAASVIHPEPEQSQPAPVKVPDSTVSETMPAPAGSAFFAMFGGGPSDAAPATTDKVAESGEQEAGLFGMFGGITGLSATLQEKGGALMAGGLDTLELIGKKTVQALTDDDPGFRGARKRLTGQPQRPNLSEMLDEARTHAQSTSQEPSEVTAPRQLGYNDYFEEYHGMVHLEALELLYRQSSSMVSGMSTDAEPSVVRTSKQYAGQFASTREEAEQIEEDEETIFDGDKCLSSLQESIDSLHLQVPVQNLAKMIRVCEERCRSLDESHEAKEIHEMAVRSLAQLTAASMEVFHKTAELLMLPNTDGDEDAETLANAKCSICFNFTQRVCEQLAFLSNSFVKGLNACDSSDKDSISALITSVFLEAANSASFTWDGCDFLLPSVQVLYLTRAQS